MYDVYTSLSLYRYACIYIYIYTCYELNTYTDVYMHVYATEKTNSGTKFCRRCGRRRGCRALPGLHIYIYTHIYIYSTSLDSMY